MIEKITSNDNDIPETFNKFNTNLVTNLKIIPRIIEQELKNALRNAINKLKNHRNIKMIKFNPGTSHQQK